MTKDQRPKTKQSMLSEAIEQIERLALRLKPERAKRLLGAVPSGAVAALQRARFRQTLRLAAERSPFYRDQFRRRGIDIRQIEHPSDLGDFYTTGENLRANGARDFLASRADTSFETTGTTSPAPKRVFFSHHEIDGMGRANALALYFLGLRRDDVVLSAYDCSFWVSPAVLRSALQYLGCFHAEAGKIEPAEFLERARHYRPSVIFGEPSWLIRLSEIASGRDLWPLKFLFAGGENIAESTRQTVEQIWKAPLYLNYGQTEAFGSTGFECAQQEGYHRNDLHFIFEIINPDETGDGELVYTTITRNVMPLIRYRSTDITRLVEEPCACGLFAKRIAKIRSRADEMVVCGMGNVGPWVFAEILRDVTWAGADWQAVIKHDGRRDVVELHVELKNLAHQAEAERAVLLHLRERFADFWRNYEMKLYDLRVIGIAPGSLRPGRKLRRVVDDRQMMLRQVV